MSSVMNLNVTLMNEPLLAATDPAELKRALAWVAGEVQWLLSVAASMEGRAWPSDTESRAGSIHSICETNTASTFPRNHPSVPAQELMSNSSAQIVQKLWSYCNVLRDDGLSYGDYVEQLTFLLFLKMAHERTQPLWSQKLFIPEG